MKFRIELLIVGLVMAVGLIGVSEAATFFAQGNNIDTQGGNVTTQYLFVNSSPAQCSANYAMTFYNGSHSICTLFNGSGNAANIETSINTQIAFYNGTDAIAGASDLCWNESSGYLGVGTCSPGAALDVNGNVQIGGNFIAYGSGVHDFTNGDMDIGDTNLTGYFNFDTPADDNCIDFAQYGNKVCGNSTATWIESPGGVKVIASD